ncbi:MAG: choice-of-anchor tandem repeat GloVer-containing protein, partial [Cyanobacteria bacterium J06648_11]
PSIDRGPSRIGSFEGLSVPFDPFDLRLPTQAPEREVIRVISRPRLEGSRTDDNVLATFTAADLGCDGTRCAVPEALELIPPNFGARLGVYSIRYEFFGLDDSNADAQTIIERFLTVLPDAQLLETSVPLSELVLGGRDRLLGVERSDATTGAGRVVRIDLNPPTLAIVDEFDGANGRNPRSGLTLANDGNYYGTTLAGGNGDRGTIFKLGASDSIEVVHQFGLQSSGPIGRLLLANNSKLYGTTTQTATTAKGTAFEFDPSTQTFAVLHEFNFSDARSRVQTALIQASDGQLYGASNEGLFRLTLEGDFADLSEHSLFEPLGPIRVVERDRAIYITYPSLGGFGRIDRYDLNSGTTGTVHVFSSSDGASPAGGLVLADDGGLYGTTSSGGQFGLGGLYRLDAGDRFELLHSFDGESDFARPGVPLTSAGANTFYVPGDGGVNVFVFPAVP